MSLHFYIVIRISVIYRFYLHKYLFPSVTASRLPYPVILFSIARSPCLIYYIGILTHYFFIIPQVLVFEQSYFKFFEKFITKITEMYPSSLLFRKNRRTVKFSSSVYRLNYFLFLSYLQINPLYQPHLSEFQVSLLYRPFPHLTILSF